MRVPGRVALQPLTMAVVGGVLAVLGLVLADGMLLLVGVSVVATVALMGGDAEPVFWPLGLGAVILSAYGMYVISWMIGADGLDRQRAGNFFLVVLVGFGMVAIGRSVVGGDPKSKICGSNLSVFVSGVAILAVPVLLVVLVRLRTEYNPERLISAHLGGGDHGAHNLIIHRLIDPSAGSELVRPTSMYAYPRSVHYLIALLNRFDQGVSKLPVVASEYLSATQFEYVQLAAYVQLSLLIVRGRSRMVARSLASVAPVIFVMSIDGFVAHLFWSGFTTSLAVTWILLLPFALHRAGLFPEGIIRRSIGWCLLAMLCWITYQPFVVVGLALLAGDLWSAFVLHRRVKLRGIQFSSRWSALVIAAAIPAIAVAAPLLLRGRTSPAVTSLLADGALYRPHLWTVVVGFIAVLFLMSDKSQPAQDMSHILVSLAGLIVGAILVVRSAGGLGVTDQPYYVQKMYWVLLFMCVPLVIGLMADATFDIAARMEIRGTVALVLIVTAAVLGPLALGRSPAAATRHFSVDWFAGSIVKAPRSMFSRSIAFSMRSTLENHLANLSLAGTSPARLPIRASLSGNPYLACKYANSENVDLIYTTANGPAELLASGCNRRIIFFKEGRLIGVPASVYPTLRVGVTERMAIGQPGIRFLLPGYLQPQQWGIWASGYRSGIGLRYKRTLDSPSLTLTVRSYPKDEIQRTVIVKANEAEVGRHVLGLGAPESFAVSLPRGPRGTQVEVTLTCERSDEEIIADNPADGPEPCLGLDAIRLDNYQG